MAVKKVEKAYTADSMKALNDVETMRTSPGMYVGDLSPVSVEHGKGNQSDGEHLEGYSNHLYVEVISNSIDEVNAGYGDKLEIWLHKDQSITVKDYGRGIPCDINKESGKSGLELSFYVMNAGGKFASKEEDKTYRSSTGLHGQGNCATNFLSDMLIVEVCRDGKIYTTSACRGVPGVFDKKGNFAPNKEDDPIVRIAPDKRPAAEKKERPTGTTVTFRPDPIIFSGTKVPIYDFYKFTEEQSYVTPATFIVYDEIQDKTVEYYHPDGIKEMVQNKARKYTEISPIITFSVPSKYTKDVVSEDDNGKITSVPTDFSCEIEGSLVWTNRSEPKIIGIANNVFCVGRHYDGFKNGISRALREWLPSSGAMKKADEKLKVGMDDVIDGIVGVIDIKMEERCVFTSQTKDELNNAEVLSCVSDATKEEILKWLTTKKNATAAKKIAKSILDTARLRQKQKDEKAAAKEIKEKLASLSNKPRKLYDCRNEGAGTELLICEGDSAKGTMLKARDANWQAVLPIRGVSANIYDMNDKELVKNAEFMDIINSMNAGYGAGFDYENRRFDRIGIYTDADEDGNYIRSQLLAFIYMKFPGMIENGKVFAGCPPLYSNKFIKGTRKGEIVYTPNETAQTKFMDSYVKGGGSVKDLKVARSKGLGEMDDTDMMASLLPETRTIRLIVCEDANETRDKLRLFFAKDKETVAERRQWIDENFEITND